jgi:lysophospholipase L1-like esterase
MTAPQISLSTTGTDPKSTTKQILEEAVNTAIETVWNAAVVASLGDSEADALRQELEASSVYAAGAEAARDAAIAGAFKTWPTTASGIGNGIAGVTSIVGGSGGTNGTFALAYSGGTQVLAPVGVFTVAGGALVSVVITYPGYYSSGTPTLSFAASSGLTGASATAQMAANTPVNEYFCVPSTVSGEAAIVYRNLAGVATEIVRTPSTAIVITINRRTVGISAATQNLFDKTDPDYTDNFFVSHTTGNLGANGDYAASGFIPVTATLDYFLSSKSYMAWYTAGKVFISGSSNTDTSQVQTAPANAAFLRVSLYIANGVSPDTFYVRQGNTALATYEPYGGEFVATDDRIPDGWIKPLKTSFLERGKNLFDKDATTADSGQGSGGVIVSVGYQLSALIPITPGVTYSYGSAGTGARFRSVLDANLSNRGLPNSSNTNGTTSYTAVSGDVWMRLTVADASVDLFQCEAAAAPTGFEPYGYKFTPDILPASDVVSKWSGAKASSFGDSITSQAAWQPAIAAALGLVHTAYGVGGRRVSGASGMCQDAAVNTIPSDSDLVLVMGGTNDFSASVLLGTSTSSNTSEFYGAMNQMCQKLTTRLPTAVICLLTTPYGELPANVAGAGWADGVTNLNGLTTRDYAEAVRVMGKRWGMPVIDLSECGWNTINLATFMVSDGGFVHPNATGGERIARVCIGALRAIEPTV